VQRWVQRRARFRWPSPPRTARVERDEVDKVDEVDAIVLAEVAVTLAPREELPRIKRPLPDGRAGAAGAATAGGDGRFGAEVARRAGDETPRTVTRARRPRVMRWRQMGHAE